MGCLHIDTRHVDAAAIPTGFVITDARNLYDKLRRATPVIKGAEKRSDIEALSLRENLERGQGQLLWVNGNTMLSNSLTKPHEKSQMMLYVKMNFRWKVVYDEAMVSGKQRTKMGLGAHTDIRSQNTQHANKPTSTRRKELISFEMGGPCGSAVVLFLTPATGLRSMIFPNKIVGYLCGFEKFHSFHGNIHVQDRP